MDNKFIAFFSKDSTFRWSSALAILFLIGEAFVFGMNGDVLRSLGDLAFLVLVAAIYIAYWNHSKNNMKILLGFLLGVLVSTDLRFFADGLEGGQSAMVWCMALLLVVDILFVVNHLRLNGSHAPRTGVVRNNQILVILEMILSAVTMVVEYNSGVVSELAVVIVDTLVYVGLFNCIACIEWKVNAYKVIRAQHEAAGTWNDEVKAQLKKEVFAEGVEDELADVELPQL